MTTKPYPTEQTAFTDENKRGGEMLHRKGNGHSFKALLSNYRKCLVHTTASLNHLSLYIMESLISTSACLLPHKCNWFLPVGLSAESCGFHFWRNSAGSQMNGQHNKFTALSDMKAAKYDAEV